MLQTQPWDLITTIWLFRGVGQWESAIVERCRYAIKGGSLQIRRAATIRNVIFQVADVRSLRNTRLAQNHGRFQCAYSTKLESLEFKVPMVCLVTGCVSPPRDGR